MHLIPDTFLTSLNTVMLIESKEDPQPDPPVCHVTIFLQTLLGRRICLLFVGLCYADHNLPLFSADLQNTMNSINKVLCWDQETNT